MLRAKFPDWLTTHVLVLSILLAGVSAVRAGEASTQDPSTGDKLEEITVTAQKREQNLQDVGTSVTAFESAGLQRLGLHNVTDIAEQVPGLQFNQYGSTVTVYNLRGVSQNDFSDHQEAPVAKAKAPKPPKAKAELTIIREASSALPRRERRPLTNMRQRK